MQTLNIWEKIAIQEHKKATHIRRNIFGNIVFVKRYLGGVEDETITNQHDDLFKSIHAGETVSIEELKGNQQW